MLSLSVVRVCVFLVSVQVEDDEGQTDECIHCYISFAVRGE